LDQFIYWKLHKGLLPKNPILLTFDDGHLNNYIIVREIINEYQIKAVFFIKTGVLGILKENYFEQLVNTIESQKCQNFIYDGFRFNFRLNSGLKNFYDYFRKLNFSKQTDLINEFYKNFQNIQNDVDKLKYSHITNKMCLELIADGHYIQSHTVNHYILSSLTNADLKKELENSLLFIENEFKHKVHAVAYPFGDPEYDFGERDMMQANLSGYKVGFSGEAINGRYFVQKNMNNYNLPRFGIVNVDMPYFKMLLSGFRI
jgi:peptidoglycan/xylan/chitin deacetylase (PgdA/CDA1 family)